MPSLLLYGKGGLAYGGVNNSIQNTQVWSTTGGAQAGFNSVMLGNRSYSSIQVGWTAGGGVECMFMPSWSAKPEYLYYHLGGVSGSVVNNYYGTGGFSGNDGIQSVTNYIGRVSGNIARLGVNYR